MLRMYKIIGCKRFAYNWSFSRFFFTFAEAAFINSLNRGNKYISWCNKLEFIHCQMSKIFENELSLWQFYYIILLHGNVTTTVNGNVNIYQAISWAMLLYLHIIMKISKYKSCDEAILQNIYICYVKKRIVGQNGNICNIAYFEKSKKSDATRPTHMRTHTHIIQVIFYINYIIILILRVKFKISIWLSY